MSIKHTIREHLQSHSVHVMQLATAADSVPWASNLHFDADEDFNIYWLSVPDCRHSEEIAKNPNVSAAVAIHETPPMIGLQIAGTAEEVPFEGNEAILHQYAARHDRRDLVERTMSGEAKFRLYRLTPEFIDLIDLKNFPDHNKQTWRP